MNSGDCVRFCEGNAKIRSFHNCDSERFLFDYIGVDAETVLGTCGPNVYFLALLCPVRRPKIGLIWAATNDSI